MWESRDTRSVELVLNLPRDLANDVEAVQKHDPEFLHRVIRYGITRRAVYEELNQNLTGGMPEA